MFGAPHEHATHHITPLDTFPEQDIVHARPVTKFCTIVVSRVKIVGVLNGHGEVHGNMKSHQGTNYTKVCVMLPKLGICSIK